MELKRAWVHGYTRLRCNTHKGRTSIFTEEERILIPPMIKNNIEKYTLAGDFENAKARVLMRGWPTEVTWGETRSLSATRGLSNARYLDFEVFKVDITVAYLNTR